MGPGSVTSTTAFTATATNAGGSTAANLTVQVATGGGGAISCAAQGYPNTKVIDIAWADALVNTSAYGGFNPADAIVFRFTTPATGGGSINGYEYIGPPSPRTGALSATPCNFSVGIPTYRSSGDSAAFINNVAPAVSFSVTTQVRYAATLLPDTVYYLNIINSPGASGGDMQFNINMQ